MKRTFSLVLVLFVFIAFRSAEEAAALQMAQAFVDYTSSIGMRPDASSQAALCLCPETMEALGREGETRPRGENWHTTSENPEIVFRGLQGAAHLEDAQLVFPNRAIREWSVMYQDDFVVFQSPDKQARVWLRFGGRSFLHRGDARWWCVSKWDA